MSSGPLPAVLEHLRKWAARETGPHSDAELLSRFCANREGDAFAALMRRHGRMVWGVCRHVLRHDQDAEDAFQATFLVLARKAASIHKGTALASWLHGTAYHIATRARRDAITRRTHEKKGESMPPVEPISETACREVLAILDEEVRRLSARQQAAFVLCVLEGKSMVEAARVLGWKEGTLSGTLSRAREQLRKRLARRGVTLSALLTGLAISGESSAPAALVERTLRVVVGKAAGAVSAQVASLAQGAIRSFAVTKLRFAVFVLATTVAAGGVIGFARQKPNGKEEANAQTPAAGADHAKPEETPRERVDRYGDPLPPEAIARIGTVRFRDGDGIFSLAYSPDGKILASGTGYREGVIRLWDAATGKEQFLLQPHDGFVYSLAFSPDGKMLASMGTRNEGQGAGAHIWDVATGKEIRTLRHRFTVGYTVAFSPDGRHLAFGGSDTMVRLWDVNSGKESLVFHGHSGMIGSFAFSPDGKTLATASNDNTLRLWDAATGKELRRLFSPGKPSRKVAFSPDSKVVAGGSTDGTVHLWEAATGRRRLTIAGHDKWRHARDCSPDGPNVVVFSPDGKTLAAGSEGAILDATTGKEVCQFQGFHRWVRCLVFSPDGKTVVGEDSHRIRFWDAASGKEIFKDSAHRDPISSLAFTPDSKTLATASRDDSIGLWDANTGRECFRFQGRREAEMHGNRIALAPDGRTGAAWLGDGLYSWDMRKPEAVREGSAGVGFDYQRGVAFSPRNHLLAAVWKHKDKRIRLWAEGMAKEPRLLKVHESGNNGLIFSPDGKTLASGSSDNIAGLWDVATGEELRTLRIAGGHTAVTSLAFSSDNATLALGGSNGTIGLWDRATGKEFRRFLVPDRWVAALAFSPDGRTLAAGYDDGGIIRFWEVATGKIRREWQAHPNSVHSLAFSPDSKLLASAGTDTTVLIWDVAPGPKTRDLNAETLEALWTDLASADAVKAYRAIGALRAASRQTVPFLKVRLRPVPAVNPTHVARIIADLDDEKFAVREQASMALARMADQAAPILRKTLTERPSLEVRRRIQTILEKLNLPLASERLREVRAVESLEQIGTPPAWELLRALAKGAPESRLTREAKASLQRRFPQSAPKP